MSGPKISVYELSAWARRNLSGQIRCQQQTFACVEQIRNLIREILSSSGSIDSILSNLSMLLERTGKGAEEVQLLTDLKATLKKDCAAFQKDLEDNIPQPATTITISDEALADKKALLGKIKAIQTEAASYQANLCKVLSQGGHQNKEHSGELYDDIVSDINAAASFDIAVIDVAKDDFHTTYKMLERKLSSLMLDSSCPAEIKAEAKKAVTALGKITDLDYLKTFEAVSVKPLLKKYQDAVSRLSKIQNDYQMLLTRYLALFTLTGSEAKTVPITDEAISLLQTEISKLEKQLVRQKEQEYISSCVDQVMVEMGYDLLGHREVTKRSGKRFRNELYSYGKGTAVNVTYASDGQITMELGGIDRADRVPNLEETDMLREDMESFCEDFAEIEKRLQAKSVIIGKRIAMSPPSTEYASIININDYEVKSSKPIATITVTNKRKRTSVKQTMRRDDS
ncbi:hypothetical protein Psch_01323 [Pelotomaculum schinkii]|uniref:Uncharacterized protein n=1 Tax=Pelotomaculum schinkii TaxID=78350 RepID=A0A4Y7RFI6_9FIRM|nr:hypothetical protein [Pelotomaculum schinkii]TEB07768.1 hypothetical protein Psch_01323 [Pelotomaculum schinkii]